MFQFLLLLSLVIPGLIFSAEENIAVQRQSSTVDNDLTLSWSVPEDDFRAGASIIASLEIANSGTRTIILVLTIDQQLINPLVWREGKPIMLTAFGTFMRDASARLTRVKLGPGQRQRAHVRLSRCFDLSLSGPYEATAQVFYEVEGLEISLSLKSKPIGFRVSEIYDDEAADSAGKINKGQASPEHAK